MALPSPLFIKPEDKEKPVEKKIYQPQFRHQKTENQDSRENNFFKPKFQQQRKPFVRKKEWNFPCTYCNVGYDTQKELFAHRKSHEQCPFDGCRFNASAGKKSETIL